ncbi:MAG: transglycosylase SLT domain-containing protein [Deltaproteobacteria bacterium]|nr:transglycosylase SLT domain-containing protein [Deltaproteobacteria bacterium]
MAETGWCSEPAVDRHEQFPALVSAVKVKEPLSFCGEPVPLQDQDVRERFDKEFMAALWNRPQAILWLKRSSRYMPYIEEQLKKNAMPDDLKYLVIVESGLLPHAGSPKGAVGYWQFIESTGRNNDLTITGHIDERRNIFTSTDAAIRYLGKLYRMTGSWTLAAAAYNMGEEGLKSEILIQKINDYYKLYLPLETQQYVFRIMAAKLILCHPARYGFKLAKEDLYPPLTFDRVEIECPEDAPLQIVAEAAGTTFKEMKTLNPEVRGYYLAKGRHVIAVPKGAAAGFPERMEKGLNQWEQERQKSVYTVKSGDSLSSIAARFNVPLPALLIWNRMGKARKLSPGEHLLVFSADMKKDEAQQP